MSQQINPLPSEKLEVQSKPLFTPPLQSLAEGKLSLKVFLKYFFSESEGYYVSSNGRSGY